MYIYYHIKRLLHMKRVKLQHYSIKNQMPWMAYTWTNYMPNQITKQRETYAAIVDELGGLLGPRMVRVSGMAEIE